MAYAYSVPSVPTWNLPIAPLTLIFCSLSCGPIVGLFGLLFAKQTPTHAQLNAAIVIVAAATAANVIALMAEWDSLDAIATTVVAAISLVPFFPLSIIAYATLNVISISILVIASRHASDPRMTPVAAAAALSLLACFAVRFAFYSMHMTSGL